MNARELEIAATEGAGGGEENRLEYQEQQLVVHEDGSSRKFNLDSVFPPDTQQASVYDAVAKETVESVVRGYNGTIFAYGQTGSGKSHSMMGPPELMRQLSVGDVTSDAKGIIPRTVDHLFQLIKASPDAEFKVSVSYLEVYQEQISDLLVPDRRSTNLKLVEVERGRFATRGLTRKHVTSAKEVITCLKDGDECRTIRSTDMNAVSSRSHAVLEICVVRDNIDGSQTTGTLNLVDLAGSESVGKTGAEGQALEEAKKINQSLSALGNVIKALGDGKPHVPYRDSTLTKILMASLGGNCRTSLLLAASPSSDNFAETISTLRFGERAKKIKTALKANEKKSQAALQKQVAALLKRISELEAYITELESALAQGGVSVDIDTLQRNATVATADERLDTTVGDLLLLQSQLADEKERTKLLEYELDTAQKETQAAEIYMQSHARELTEAKAAAQKAADDAKKCVAEMQRDCDDRVAKAEAQADDRIAAHVARTTATAAASTSERDEILERLSEQVEAAARKCLEEQRRADAADASLADFKRRLERCKERETQLQAQAADQLQQELTNLSKEHALNLERERKSWEGRAVEPSEEELARQAEMETRLSSVESERDALLTSSTGRIEALVRESSEILSLGREMLQKESYECVAVLHKGLAELRKERQLHSDDVVVEHASRLDELDAQLAAALVEAQESHSAYVAACMSACVSGAPVRTLDGAHVGEVVTTASNVEYALPSVPEPEPELETEASDIPTVSVRWTSGVLDNGIRVTSLTSATIAEQVSAVVWCKVGVVCVHDGRTGRVDSTVSKEDACVSVVWQDATHTQLPAVKLQIATEVQKESFERQYIVQLRADGLEVTIPGGITKAMGYVALEEEDDGWRKELFKLGLTSICLCDNVGLTLFKHQIKVETDETADWVFYDKTGDYYALSTNHGVALLSDTKTKDFNSNDPTLTRVKKSLVGATSVTQREQESLGFAGPLAFAVGKVSGTVLHRQHSITLPQGGDDAHATEEAKTSASTLLSRSSRHAPEGACLKQKPSLKTWPSRWAKLDGVSLLFFDKKGCTKPRGSSILDVTGCTVTEREEKFTFDGTHYLITLERRGHTSGLPDLQGGGVSRFCFKNKPDRDAFASALRNVVDGKAWDAA
eukprot:COSAG02_NODE_12_length_58022_cov_242.077379_15_plen_1141_part_00